MLETREDFPIAVMPFVLCRSGGGPYDDESFVSGWRLGAIDAVLAGPGIGALAEAIRINELVQADLLAMARGYAMSVDSASDSGWLSVTFTRLGDVGTRVDR